MKRPVKTNWIVFLFFYLLSSIECFVLIQLLSIGHEEFWFEILFLIWNKLDLEKIKIKIKWKNGTMNELEKIVDFM